MHKHAEAKAIPQLNSCFCAGQNNTKKEQKNHNASGRIPDKRGMTAKDPANRAELILSF